MNTSNSPHRAATDINHLTRGHVYRATTTDGASAIGEYLGIEVAYDVWCILLRGEHATSSIPTCDIAHIETHLQVA